MGRQKKGKQQTGRFLLLPHMVLCSPSFHELSGSAVKLLIDIAVQYNGKNNGDLACAFKVMKPKGWRSEATLDRAKKELLAAGFIAETRKGHLPNTCSLYGITWQPLNPNGKLDIGPAGFPYGEWARRLQVDKAHGARTTTKTGAKARSIAADLEVDNWAVATETKAISK